ncbi:hypothetical protein L1987_05983 [Smallanthus sonchifolius]|uniref:Uncharacterized protein n=1 Tax=Smallanthus sonchifolius TaxID=185202 RepID=A0ACB9JX47_9ASTR|nr:hypothetical protein L1987_05983 [Smallanthus sonchifolius]
MAEIDVGAAHGDTPDIKDAAALCSQHQNNLFTLPFFPEGCGVVVVDTKRDHVIGQTGIAIVWGLVVMVPSYIIAQILGSTLASGTLRLIFDSKNNDLGATVPSGSNLQSLVLEFIITFYLMFVISVVATDDRAVSTKFQVSCLPILSLIFNRGQYRAINEPSPDPRPGHLSNQYQGLWVYMLGPVLGAIAGAWAYSIIRFTDKPVREIVKSSSFLQKLDGHICPF